MYKRQCCHHVDPPHPSIFTLCKFALSYVIPQTPTKIGSPWPASSECWIEEMERMRDLWLSYYGRKRKTTIADCHLPKEHRKQIISSTINACGWEYFGTGCLLNQTAGPQLPLTFSSVSVCFREGMIRATRRRRMNRVKNRVIHPYFSDIDLVIFGAWSELPLRTIERELLDRNIASPENLKVLDRAAVSWLPQDQPCVSSVNC